MQPHWPLTLYHDGDCPLCAREIAWLKRRARPDRLQLSDIRAADFDPEAIDRSLAQLQNLLHGRFADGRWVTGLDATYWSWIAAGHPWLAEPLSWRWLRPAVNSLYRQFCRLRPSLAWLPHPDGAQRCQNDACNAEKSRR